VTHLGNNPKRPVLRRILLAGIALATFVSGQAARSPAAAADLFATNVPGVSAVGGPPAGFDPVHATDAELKAYAMPPRPNPTTHPREYGNWKRAMLLVKTREIGEVTLTGRYHGPAAITGHHTDASRGNTINTSGNWSGFVNLNGLTSYNTSSSYSFITSDFVIPVVKKIVCNSQWVVSSQWVGIDGYSNADVLQAGTEADAYCNPTFGPSTSYYAWFEWYPYNEVRSSVQVSPGDDMYVNVWDTSPTTGYAYIENQNTGVAQEYYLTAPKGTSLIGNSAEWILEAPSNEGSTTLADYNNDWFWGGSAFTFAGNVYVAGSPSSVQVNMVQGGKTVSVPFLANSQVTEYVYY
jgi:hypothetical protein